MIVRDTARWLEWAGTLEQALLAVQPDYLVCVTDFTQAVCWEGAPRGEWLYDARRFISGARPRDMLEHIARYAPHFLREPYIWKPREGWTWNILMQPSGYYAVFGNIWPVERIDAALCLNVAEWVPMSASVPRCPSDGEVLNIHGQPGYERFTCDSCGYEQ